MELGDYDESGRRNPYPIRGSKFVLDVDTVIPEIGYAPELNCLENGDGFRFRRNGTIEVDPLTLTTDIPGVFAGGDVNIGPSTVVQAMAEGYRGAQSIDRYLKGQNLYKDRVYRALRRANVSKPESDGKSEERVQQRARMRYLGVGRRVKSFSEVSLGFGEETALREAQRCLRCDLED